ncbi:hypothetical protein E4P82_10105 [Candidatus Competibacter phosphatis]|uniref:Zinc finger/thioredoxin putative domain-containing protein n=1 Tax=Candidatus Competibacter phosphatis TaxID=221280 RepID=A0ABX1TNN6_9GAMM|nr:hypothetical protein [Candidatus Competibacter phosphatis]NMQ19515.1 hypothetical protein [Candidatus Competibacter phosphatis]
MRQALQVKCWKCKDAFTMSAEPSRKLGPLVEAKISCPFCEAINQVTVRAGQLKSVILYRDGESVEAVDLDKPGALLGQVFEGTPPDVT